jgi:hypothetical protein
MKELTTEAQRSRRKNHHGGTTRRRGDGERRGHGKKSKKDLTADIRRQTRTKIFTTETQQGDAEMGRDGDAARKAKKN